MSECRHELLANRVLQTLFGIILDALTLGILFSRISHPMQRSHSIFLSENAVMLRRDGILKFCFRCADIKITQVRCCRYVVPISGELLRLIQTAYNSSRQHA